MCTNMATCLSLNQELNPIVPMAVNVRQITKMSRKAVDRTIRTLLAQQVHSDGGVVSFVH